MTDNDGIEYDTPIHTKYKDWNEARAALVACLPPKQSKPRSHKIAVRVVQTITKKCEDLRRRPNPTEITHWHDHDDMNLLDITKRIEARAAEIEVWDWAAVVILQNLAGPDAINARRVKIPRHPISLTLVDKCLLDLRIIYEQVAADLTPR